MSKRSLVWLFTVCAVFLTACQENKKVNAEPQSATEVEAAEDTSAEVQSEDDMHITDFSLPAPDGTKTSVMSLVQQNRITILDFWASWCGPCVREMPSMVNLYKNYHDKGLGIIGLSLDNDHMNWVKAIASLNIEWPQLSDLKGWESMAAQLFEVTSIPHMVVVDKEGTILAQGLRGAELEQCIAELLK